MKPAPAAGSYPVRNADLRTLCFLPLVFMDNGASPDWIYVRE